MSIRSETATTLHGDIKYKVVQCDSCGEEVMKDDATEFTLGNREGWACEYCTEEGPIDFPTERQLRIPLAVLFALFWPLLIFLAAYGRGEADLYYLAGSIGAVVYIGGLGILIGVVVI